MSLTTYSINKVDNEYKIIFTLDNKCEIIVDIMYFTDSPLKYKRDIDGTIYEKYIFVDKVIKIINVTKVQNTKTISIRKFKIDKELKSFLLSDLTKERD